MSLCYFHVWADFLWTASQWAIWEPSFTHTTGFGGKNRGFACCGSWVQVGVESGLLQRLNKTPHAEYRTVGLMLRRWPFVTCQKNKRTHVYLATANSYGLLLFFNQRWSVFFMLTYFLMPVYYEGIQLQKSTFKTLFCLLENSNQPNNN